MATVRVPRHTEAEYLVMAEASEERLEFVNGEVFAMAGASPIHEALVMNVGSVLSGKLRGRPCRPFGSNLRVKISETGMYCYPDVTVVCGKLELEPTRPATLLNPAVIFEVLSESTEGYDRGAKAAHYRRHPGLKAYVLVSTDAKRIEVYSRSEAGWTLTEARETGELRIEALDLALPLDEVYAGFDELTAEAAEAVAPPAP
ncbi:hypothetical protein LBMAG42_32750 [Deltaproteobacteria bacterium]|nr:hypothetical protein LBMAG42_32750 [Deltaproteobacteria bacterium]